MDNSRSMIYKYLITFIIACALCYLFPYTGDDWVWGSSAGLERLETWFANYSGRYIGNLIVLALTRSRILRAIVMSITYTGILYCIERITQRSWAFIVALLGLLLLPRMLLSQAVVWTSGFANYATSIFLTLIFFVYLNEHGLDKEYPVSFPTVILLVALGFCNTLIVEHLTVFHAIMSIILFSYGIYACKKIKIDYLTYMIGCISGTVLMFSNSVFQTIASNGDKYRQVAGNGIIYRTIVNYFSVIYHEGYFNNHYINIIIFSACVLLYLQYLRSRPSRNAFSIATICLVIMTGFMVCSLSFFAINGYGDTDQYSLTNDVLFYGVITFMNLGATITLSLLTTYKDSINYRILLLWSAALMIIAPLFAVTPIGSRCFFATYIILILIGCELIKCISTQTFSFTAKMRKYLVLSGSVLIALCTVYQFRIFFEIYQADQHRYQHIMDELNSGSKNIELTHLPYEDRLWTATPFKDNDVWEKQYKLFYGIPDDVDLIVAEN